MSERRETRREEEKRGEKRNGRGEREKKWTLRVARGWHTLTKVILNWTDRSCIMERREKVHLFALSAPITSGAGERGETSELKSAVEKMTRCHLME